MELEYSNGKIFYSKELTHLDNFILDFIKILNKHDVNYVLISGYVSILFGRSRNTEDIDLFIEKIPFEKFKLLWLDLIKDFTCINTSDSVDAYKEYLSEDIAIRFSLKDSFIPNIEVKFPKMELDYWSIKNKVEVNINQDQKLFISPLELQIPFKLYLGSEKDIEDAKFLYAIFKGRLDMQILLDFNRKLKIEHLFDRYLK